MGLRFQHGHPVERLPRTPPLELVDGHRATQERIDYIIEKEQTAHLALCDDVEYRWVVA